MTSATSSWRAHTASSSSARTIASSPFEEKPEQPRSTLAATATYLYHRAHVPLVRRYLDEGNSPDQPGRLVAWLAAREPVFGYRFEGDWRDIGDARQLLEADNRLRALNGLPPRDAYALD